MRVLQILIAALAILISAIAVVWLAQPTADPLAGAAPRLVARGQDVAQACEVCHAIAPGSAPRIGPSLRGIVGRPVAGVAGHGYSPAMRAAGGTWTVDRLDAFLTDPRRYLPGTSMAYAGLHDDADRAALIAYLETLDTDR